MSDSYYELVDDGVDDGQGLAQRFIATDLVRSTWSHAIQHGAPPSALLVRGLERCAQRDDTRLSRVVIDLLGPFQLKATCGFAPGSNAQANRSNWWAPRCWPLDRPVSPVRSPARAGGG